MRADTKYKGSIKLSAIGDALGWMTEFEKTEESLFNKFGTYKIDEFYPWKKRVGGRFYGFIDNINAGSYSDDTQLLLAVARSIKGNGNVDHNYFAKVELINWLEYARGGGRTIKNAANKIARKSTQWNNNFFNFKVNDELYDYRNSGANGAAMRVLPIALANIGNIEKIKEEIFCNSIITHGHPRAILGAMLYGYAVNQIIVYRPENFNWENYLVQIGLNFQEKFELTFANRIEVKQWLIEWNKGGVESFEKIYNSTVLEVQNQLRFIFQSIKQNLSVSDTLKKLGCFDQATKGSGTATVLAGIYFCAKFQDKPLVAIVEAVNSLGSDTDSIAGFTGGLVGALHGQSIIPRKWELVQDIQYLNSIAERLLAISEDRLNEDKQPPAFNLKLLNNPKTDNFQKGEIIEFVPLGKGEIISVEKQSALTKGKYNLIVEAKFDSGQSIILSKLFESQVSFEEIPESISKDTIINLANERLNSNAFVSLKEFFSKGKGVSKEFLKLLEVVLKNDS